MQLLNRLKLWQKLALLVAAMAVPTALLGVFYLSAANSEVAQARNELAGADYAHQVGAVLADVANHRSLLFAVLTGDASRRDELATSEAAIDKLIADVDDSDAAVGAQLGVADDWRGIKTDWQQLKSDEAKLSADDAVARHDALIARIVKLGDLVIGRSALNVDPSPQTAALIQIATRDVPGALIASGNVQWYATRASIKGYLGGDDQMALSLYHDEVVDDFAAATRDLNGAPAAARAKIAPALEAAQGAFDSSYGIVQAKIINAQKMTITTAELFADSRAISSSLQSLSDLGYSTMASRGEAAPVAGDDLAQPDGRNHGHRPRRGARPVLAHHRARSPRRSRRRSRCSAASRPANTTTRSISPARTRPAGCCARWMTCRGSCAPRSRTSGWWPPRTPACARRSTRYRLPWCSPTGSSGSSISTTRQAPASPAPSTRSA